MSGGIVQLVAIGAQDAYLTGKPEVSFYRSSYKRYTHFANSVERQLISGSPSAGGISTIRFEKKGDLLSYVYMTARDASGAIVPNLNWTSNIIDKVELLIGGQVIDTQDSEWMNNIEPVVGAVNTNQRLLNPYVNGSITPGSNVNTFQALKFFFCKDWQSALPLVALQYHDIELRITWSANLNSTATSSSTNISPAVSYAQLQYILWTNFIYLDQSERDYFAKQPQDMLITQVQRQMVPNASMMELAFAHPIKYLAFSSNSYNTVYATSATAASALQFKTQVNGVDIGESKALPHWVDTAQYYHTPNGYAPFGAVANVAIVPFCLDTAKLQPTGTLNFSRIDTYRIVTPATVTVKTLTLNSQNNAAAYIYAVNYNVLRIQGGMGALLYSS
jgi:hypothetical protein